MRTYAIQFLKLSTFFILFTGCQKFLDVKPDSKRNIPTTVRDFQLLLDNNTMLNSASSSAPEVLSDDYYLTEIDYNSITNAHDRGMYIWDANDQADNHWNSPYRAVLIANVAMDGLKNIEPSSNETLIWRHSLGSAHFLRAFFIEGQLQIFSLPYHSSTAGETPGVPLRLTSDFNEVSTRPSVEEGYNLVLNDLRIAAELLPEKAIVKTRPSKPAAYGMLAKIFLTMHQYDSAGVYAEKCLNIYDSLLDYNTLNQNSNAPFIPLNREVIYFSRSLNPTILNPNRAKIDSVLISSYSPNDLRLGLYYRRNPDGSYRFKGDYNGSGVNSGYHFSGVVTDEQYLIVAEAAARNGNGEKAAFWLNKLLETRHKVGSFVPYTGDNVNNLLKIIIQERRKSLPFRGARWRDLRRFSVDPEFVIRPMRTINGTQFTLNPNTPGYRLLLPERVKQRTNLVDFP